MQNKEKATTKQQKYTNQDLKDMQSWSLERKIRVSQTRIIEFCRKYDDKIYVLSISNADS